MWQLRIAMHDMFPLTFAVANCFMLWWYDIKMYYRPHYVTTCTADFCLYVTTIKISIVHQYMTVKVADNATGIYRDVTRISWCLQSGKNSPFCSNVWLETSKRSSFELLCLCEFSDPSQRPGDAEIFPCSAQSYKLVEYLQMKQKIIYIILFIS